MRAAFRTQWIEAPGAFRLGITAQSGNYPFHRKGRRTYTIGGKRPSKVRDGSPLDVPLMLFAWDKAAGMHLYKGEKPREEKEKRKEKELVCVARDIFGRQTHITYIDLCEQLQQVLDVKERTAKSYVRFMRERDIIIKDPSNQSYFMIGLI